MKNQLGRLYEKFLQVDTIFPLKKYFLDERIICFNVHKLPLLHITPANGQPKQHVGCPAEAASFVAGTKLSKLLCYYFKWLNKMVNS